MQMQNKDKNKYDFIELVKSSPSLLQYIKLNEYNNQTIDFFNPAAVKSLNKALLKHNYNINWDIPQGYLCPPVPGRADYLHHIANFLQKELSDSPKRRIKCLDVGVGANCIYPLIGSREYSWDFVGSDIDNIAIESAKNNISKNPSLKNNIEIRLQNNKQQIFKGIILENEFFDLSICNPPFHSSVAEAQSGTIRKLNNLKHKKHKKATLNFGGQNNELWCQGGEKQFIKTMIAESKDFSTSVRWFSTLVSKKDNLKYFYNYLKLAKATKVKTINMEKGNKISRILVWSFL